MQYSILASVSTENHTPHITIKDFETHLEADNYARELAEELYYLNPKRDILEILKEEEDIDEDTARIVFKLEMFRNINYSAKQIGD
jgi:hypothetical protein